MGRATRWLNCVLCWLCVKKVEGHSGSESIDKLRSNPSTIPPNITPTQAAWLPSSSNPAAATAVKMIGKTGTDENWIHSSNSSNNLVEEKQEEEEEEEESLSLSDLPIHEENHHESIKESNSTPSPEPIFDHQEGFSFRSWDDSSSKESDICIADEVFCQGQILPMRSQSISFDSARTSSGSTGSWCISMDHCSFSASFTSVSTRSSSSGSSRATTTMPKNKPRPKIEDQFQFFQPSPKPHIQSLNVKNGGRRTINPNRKPTFWRLFRVGLMTTTPDIAKQDLKFRIKSNASR